MHPSLASLDVISGEARAERGAQLQHFHALDGKAGIILGFAGAVMALAPSDNPVVKVGRAAAAVAGLAALWAFWPREFQVMDLNTLRQKYLTAEPRFSRLAILDTQISMIGEATDLLRRKANRLKAAMAFLASGVVLWRRGWR